MPPISRHALRAACLLVALMGACAHDPARAELIAIQKQESFDSDPGWDEHNNRAGTANCRTTRQDFGWSADSSHAGGAPGEMGGYIQPAADLCYYGKVLPTLTYEDPLSASGTLCFPEEHARGHFQIGFFHHAAQGWRTPHTINLRIIGRGDHFYAYIGYLTGKWRAGENTFGSVNPGNERFIEHPFPVGGRVYPWSFRYDPQGNQGGGTIMATMGDQTAVLNLGEGHKADGARMDRFGLQPIMKSNDDPGTVYLDNLTINGVREDFTTDPGWEGHRNRRTYEDCIVRPRFNFGFSPTDFAGGQPGEMGGRTFRGDWRNPEMLAFYGDRLEDLSLEGPLQASGKVSFRLGCTDAGTLLGFFHATHSLEDGNDCCGLPQDFLGIGVDGPSSQGFYFTPVYRVHAREQGWASTGPRIYPDGSVRDWTLDYDPKAAEGSGRITVTLDGEPVSLDLTPQNRALGARFNRFGIITTQIDGNHHLIYFDDLEYTWRQERRGTR